MHGIRDVKVRWQYAWSLFVQIHALGRVNSLVASLKSRVCNEEGHKHADHIIPGQFSEYILLH